LYILVTMFLISKFYAHILIAFRYCYIKMSQKYWPQTTEVVNFSHTRTCNVLPGHVHHRSVHIPILMRWGWPEYVLVRPPIFPKQLFLGFFDVISLSSNTGYQFCIGTTKFFYWFCLWAHFVII
jgi:hypothetical protein